MKATNASRSKSRRFLVQALYQAHLTAERPSSVVEAFITEHNMKRADIDYFRTIMRGISRSREELRAMLEPHLDRQFDDLDPIELSILLLGAYELANCIEVPYRVVINEAVELAKMFGASESFKYVNSVLDVVAREHRVLEIKKQVPK